MLLVQKGNLSRVVNMHLIDGLATDIVAEGEAGEEVQNEVVQNEVATGAGITEDSVDHLKVMREVIKNQNKIQKKGNLNQNGMRSQGDKVHIEGVVVVEPVVDVGFTDADQDQEARGLVMNIHHKMRDGQRKLVTAQKVNARKDHQEAPVEEDVQEGSEDAQGDHHHKVQVTKVIIVTTSIATVNVIMATVTMTIVTTKNDEKTVTGMETNAKEDHVMENHGDGTEAATEDSEELVVVIVAIEAAATVAIEAAATVAIEARTVAIEAAATVAIEVAAIVGIEVAIVAIESIEILVTEATEVVVKAETVWTMECRNLLKRLRK